MKINNKLLLEMDNKINGYKSYGPVILNRLERKVLEKKARKKSKLKINLKKI